MVCLEGTTHAFPKRLDGSTFASYIHRMLSVRASTSPGLLMQLKLPVGCPGGSVALVIRYVRLVVAPLTMVHFALNEFGIGFRQCSPGLEHEQKAKYDRFDDRSNT